MLVHWYMYNLQVLLDAGWPPPQLAQQAVLLWQAGVKCSSAHFPQRGRRLLQAARGCPNFWHLVHRIGSGKNFRVGAMPDIAAHIKGVADGLDKLR